jgi:HK97 family phage prohead protease
MAIERREFRKSAAVADEDGQTFHGRAIPLDSPTDIGPRATWGWEEKFNRNAFNKYLKEGDTVWLDQHDSRLPVARVSAGTLTLTKRNGGLEWDSTPTSKASYVADVVENIRAGNYGGCSVGFECVRDAWTDDDGNPSNEYEGTHREVLEAKLPEFSTVTFPAYKDTNVREDAEDRLLRERRERFENREQEDLMEQRRAVAEAAGEERTEETSEEPEATPEENSEPVDATREQDEDGIALFEGALMADMMRSARERAAKLGLDR